MTTKDKKRQRQATAQMIRTTEFMAAGTPVGDPVKPQRGARCPLRPGTRVPDLAVRWPDTGPWIMRRWHCLDHER